MLTTGGPAARTPGRSPVSGGAAALAVAALALAAALALVVAPRAAAPGGVAPGGVVPGGVAPGGVVPGGLAPGGVVPGARNPAVAPPAAVAPAAAPLAGGPGAVLPAAGLAPPRGLPVVLPPTVAVPAGAAAEFGAPSDRPLIPWSRRLRQGLLGPSGCEPDQVLDLSSWKLTLPTGSAGRPLEVLPRALGQVVGTPFFEPTPDCDGMVFRAPVTGVTTRGSHYPRSELREMSSDTVAASWSAASGTHWMAATEAFTRLPTGKPELVGAQVHDADDDIAVFRLEGANLWVTDGDNPHYRLVTGGYQLGTVFQAAFLVTENQLGAYYNGQLVAQINRPFSGAYFKVGAYTQANCTNSPCHGSNYGETVVYDLSMGHS